MMRERSRKMNELKSKAPLASASIPSSSKLEVSRRQIGAFFRERRLASGQSPETIAEILGYPTTAQLMAFEQGMQSFPLDDIFTLTNTLNIAPEDVLALMYDLSHSDEN